MNRTLAVALAALAAMSAPAAADTTYKPIVLTGQPAPAPMAGTFKSFPYHSVINDANEIAFLGSTTGGFDPNGLFLTGEGAVNHVAHVGQDAPGFAPGVKIGSFDINYHRANDKGQVTFESTLFGPGILGTGDDDTNAFANWFWSAGQLQAIAQWRTPAPGTDALYRTFDRTTLNDLGHVAFRGDLVGANVNADNDTAFWYGDPGNVQLLAREGAPAPGGVTYGDMSGFDYPYLARDGQIVYLTDLAGGGRGLFAGTAGNIQLVAKSGDQLPNSTLHYADNMGGHGVPPRVNNNGAVAFVSFLSNGSRALLAGLPGAIQVVAQTGQPAPGLGAKKFDFFFDYGINDDGHVAFRAETRFDPASDVEEAIYAGDPSGPLLIAAAGQPAPGTTGDVTFWYFHDPVINHDGQVAFFATLTGADARGPNDYGLFATGHKGDLRLIARFGDQFEVTPGDVRTIEALSHAGVNGTHIVSFNEQSELTTLIRFTNGSEGIFSAKVLPEPGALTLALLTAAATLRRRR